MASSAVNGTVTTVKNPPRGLFQLMPVASVPAAGIPAAAPDAAVPGAAAHPDLVEEVH